MDPRGDLECKFFNLTHTKPFLLVTLFVKTTDIVKSEGQMPQTRKDRHKVEIVILDGKIPIEFS